MGHRTHEEDQTEDLERQLDPGLEALGRSWRLAYGRL